jgi:hypothetical protein
MHVKAEMFFLIIRGEAHARVVDDRVLTLIHGVEGDIEMPQLDQGDEVCQLCGQGHILKILVIVPEVMLEELTYNIVDWDFGLKFEVGVDDAYVPPLFFLLHNKYQILNDAI